MSRIRTFLPGDAVPRDLLKFLCDLRFGTLVIIEETFDGQTIVRPGRKMESEESVIVADGSGNYELRDGLTFDCRHCDGPMLHAKNKAQIIVNESVWWWPDNLSLPVIPPGRGVMIDEDGAHLT